ncbi:MAG: hypothetical protein ACYS26_21420 [Planctomycetota bacterium]|jgi:hypothetical protein
MTARDLHPRSAPVAPRLQPAQLGRCLSAGLVLLLLGACRSVESTAWNLRELHTEDGSVALEGRTMSSLSFAFRRSFGPLTPGLLPESAPERPIDKPRRKVLRELGHMSEFPSKTGRQAGLQVELATWLGLNEPAPMARELSVGILVQAAERLELESSWAVPSQGTSGPGDVAAQLRPLLESEDAAERRAALEGLDAMALDVEGARRLLFGLNELLRQPRKFVGMADLVRQRHEELQKRCVALALSLAHDDPSDRVRAAALPVRLGWYPDRQYADLRECLVAGRLESMTVLLRFLAENGLPGGLEAGEEYEDWLDLLVGCTDLGYGPVVVAGLRALDRATEHLDLPPDQAPPRGTLRGEEWFLWMRFRRDQSLTPIG